MDSGAIGLCGRSASRRATSLLFMAEMGAPSSSTRPARGLRVRPSARRSVDLPQPLGPMITVNEARGICTDRSWATTSWS